jgi:UTP--glucose-1-phosphate uridylyltransferase
MNSYESTIKKKMGKNHLSTIEINNFLYNYNKFIANDSPLISSDDISNPDKLMNYSEMAENYKNIGQENSNKAVIIKLNGGLGTSMGLKKAKSLLKVKNNDTFLDIIAKQAEHKNIPLILMNSFNTQEDSLELLKSYSKLQNQNVPLDFLQSKVPKIEADTGKPAGYSENPKVEWCPPGHGDIYTSLLTSGVLEKLLAEGIEYAFISNSDNLGATMDFKILGYFADKQLPFLMEVAKRTESDKKGGHLAVKKDGQFILREKAQCPEEEMEIFQDYEKYTYFNTNNIWVNLKALKTKLQESDNNLKLPLIVNKKNINPRDEKSPQVVQLETAMGAAIEVFEHSEAICVTRDRFIPVKKTNDLLKIMSDLFYIDKNYNLVPVNINIANQIVVDLDEKYYSKVDDFYANFSQCQLILSKCKKLKITGNIKFCGKLKIFGEVVIEG